MQEVTSIFTVELVIIGEEIKKDSNDISAMLKAELGVDDVQVKQIKNFPGEKNCTNIIKADITYIYPGRPLSVKELHDFVDAGLHGLGVDKIDINKVKNFISDEEKESKENSSICEVGALV